MLGSIYERIAYLLPCLSVVWKELVFLENRYESVKIQRNRRTMASSDI